MFDIVAVALSHLIPINPYDLRHILFALIGIAGIGTVAATARLIAVCAPACSMAEAIHELETDIRHIDPIGASRRPSRVYLRRVCGSRFSFEKTVTLPQLRYDFMPRWDQSQFFLSLRPIRIATVISTAK